eukprot:TRINITY_DN76279_c0_g1_i1.p1 TRINITY_DN76279_c0_g1~~TRINITY_DN76279_c0_g1_i1.p1  ORF type:complete len:664 (-),score=130.97 TRINITY_DN76279_c0_g1_i1:70-2061(-)
MKRHGKRKHREAAEQGGNGLAVMAKTEPDVEEADYAPLESAPSNLLVKADVTALQEAEAQGGRSWKRSRGEKDSSSLMCRWVASDVEKEDPFTPSMCKADVTAFGVDAENPFGQVSEAVLIRRAARAARAAAAAAAEAEAAAAEAEAAAAAAAMTVEIPCDELIEETPALGPPTISTSPAKVSSKRRGGSAVGRMESGDMVEEKMGESFGAVVTEAAKQGILLLHVAHGGADESQKVTVSSSMCIEAAPGALLPPVLRCPGLIISGSETSVKLRYLTIESTSEADVVIEVRDGAHLHLADCRLLRGGVELHQGTAAELDQTSITDAPGAGISAVRFEELSLRACKVSRCLGDGLRLGPGRRLQVTDTFVEDCGLNGALIDGSAGSNGVWRIDGCTFSRNEQYGVWADVGGRVLWGQNSLVGNKLGDKCGKGHLQGWRSGISFRQGDDCATWIEEAGMWLPSSIVSISLDSARVLVQPRRGMVLKSACKRLNSKSSPDQTQVIPVIVSASLDKKGLKRRLAKDGSERLATGSEWVEVSVPPRALRQPRSGPSVPPPWSAMACDGMRDGFELFLSEGGAGQESWEALPKEMRSKFQRRVRMEQQETTSGRGGGKAKGKAVAAATIAKRKRVEAITGGLFRKNKPTQRRPYRRSDSGASSAASMPV